MLMHYGFDEGDKFKKCPKALKTCLQQCIKTHKRKIPAWKNAGMHPKGIDVYVDPLLMCVLLEMRDNNLSGPLSDAIPWESTGEILRFLHGVESKHKVDFGLHMFLLHLVQGLYRQQASGKAGLACFNLADTGDCITSDVSGGKCDTSGEYSYAKRLACNFEEVHHCFPTALARHIFSRTSNDTSPYLFMTEKRAEGYDRQLRELEARQTKEPVRIRGNGPHTRFRAHFKRALQYVELRGINKKTVTLHTPKRVGFRQLRRLVGLEAQDVSARAEHRSNLAFVYGGRKASRTFKPEGGPDERKDMSMAKILANRSQRKVEFNRVPPHFSPEFISTIPFDKIVPDYSHLPANIIKMLPFLLAQLINHYHKDDGLKLLGHDNPLMKSPLWNEAAWMIYRHKLNENLQGGHNSSSAINSQLRDEHCDDFVMQKAQLKAQAILLEAVGTKDAHSEARIIRKVLAEIDGSIEIISQPAPHQSHLSAVEQPPVFNASKADHVIVEEGYLELDEIDGSSEINAAPESQQSLEKGIQPRIKVPHGQFIQLQQAPPAFRVPEVLDVRTAWFKFFALGGDKKGRWYGKTAQDIDPSVTGNERKNMRDHFNKAKKVVEMLLGSNTFEHVSKLGTEHTFQLADAKVKRIWGQDVIGSCGGYKSVRSVYNIMCGKGTSIPESTCRDNSLKCLESAWQEPVPLSQQTLTFAQQQRRVDGAVASDHGLHKRNVDIASNHGQEDWYHNQNSDKQNVDSCDEQNFESCDLDVDDATMPTTVLCFLCRECHETRLFPKFARYLAHWKQHRSACGDHTVQKPMEDEVWHMWAVKQGTHSTAQYVAQGGAFMPTWSKEQQRQFMRKRIIYRRILKKHDKLVIRQLDGSNAVVRVLDEGLIKKYKEWCIKSVAYLDPNDHAKLIEPNSKENMVYVNVTSVLDILTCQTPKRLPSETTRSTPPCSSAFPSATSPISGRSHQSTASRVPECEFHPKKALFPPEDQELLFSTPQQPSKAMKQATKSPANALKHGTPALPASGRSHRYTASRVPECNSHPKKALFKSEDQERLFSTPQQPSKAIIEQEHHQEKCRIEAAIKHATKSDANALKRFCTANDHLERSGWSRCQTLEGSGILGPQQKNSNLRHPRYTVVKMPRDGNCLFHCFSHILKLEGTIRSHIAVRKELDQYVKNETGPHKIEAPLFGGIYHQFGNQSAFMPLEESLGKSYGGQLAICAFMQVYNLHIFAHRPEIESHSSDSQNIDESQVGNVQNAYHILHTQSWDEWSIDCGTYKRNFTGDHWQILQPDVCHSASEVSTAPTTQKTLETTIYHEIQTKLFASNNDSPSKRTRSSAHSEITEKGATRMLLPAPLVLAAASAQPLTSPTAVAQGADTAECSTDEMHKSSVYFMLRAVSCSRAFLRNATLDYNSNFVECLRIFEISEMLFLENDHGSTFSRVYNSDVQKVLYAFPELDETNRTFFICLGLGLNLDPFMLQFVFRSHAKVLNATFKPEIQEMKNLQLPNGEVTHRILKWCWPSEFDSVRLSVISQGQLTVFETSDTAAKCDILLKCTNRRYTLLHPIKGASVDELMRKLKVEKESLAHEQNNKMRCKRMNPFDVWSNETIYLSSSIEGSEPDENEFKTIWNQAVTECGLNYDEKQEKWTSYPDGLKITKKSDTPGSMKASSWVKVQQKLMSASISTLHQEVGTKTRQSLRSPPSASLHSTNAKQPQVVFVDAGSESGKGLYMMMTDKRIKHVAGIELQEAWFRASMRIFNFCRNRFRALGYRMPEVTIINSDMMSQTPELKYLYSSAGIMWMNNYVFDTGDSYFAEKTSNKKKPQPLVKGNPWLTDNAAFNFSNHFENVTYIAVHKPAGFAPCWNYIPFKSFQVEVTWGVGSAAGTPEVTIIQHMQHITLKNLETNCCYKLCSASQKDVNQLEDLVRRWDEVQSCLRTQLANEDPRTEHLSYTHPTRRHKIAKTRETAIQINSDDECSWTDALFNSSASQCINEAVEKDVHLMTTRANLRQWTDLLSLTDKIWLPTQIIEAYMKLLETEFVTVTYVNWNDLPDPKEAKFLRDSRVKKLVKTKVSIHFMNLSNSHWIAVKMDLIENYVAIADSLFNTFQHLHNDIFSNMAAIAKAIGCDQALNCYSIRVPDQSNSVDCGVHTCLYMLYMSQNVSVHTREFLLSDII